jgi:hypothetical protein
MPRPPQDPGDEAFPPSITEMQRRARARRGGSFGDSREPTARVPHLPMRSPHPEVRAGEAIAQSVRRAGGAAAGTWSRLGRQRVWVVAGAALLAGGLVGGVFAFGVRRAAPEPPPVAAPGPAAAAVPVPAAAAPERPPAAPGDDPPPRPAAAAPAAEAPARPPPSRLALGANAPATLIIISEPFGAEIAVNGQATGLKTPDSVDNLAPGRTYKVTLTRTGYQTWEEDVEVATGGPKHVSAKLTRGGRTRR